MDTRNTRREYRRPELVSLGRVELETRGINGTYDEPEMPKPPAF